MSSYVTLGAQAPSRATDVVLSVLRMQAPSSSNAKGLCVVESLTAVGKVGLEFGLQLAVGAVMVALVALSAWFKFRVRPSLRWCQVCRGKRLQSPAFVAGTGSLRTRLLDARASGTSGEYGDMPYDTEGSRVYSMNLDQRRRASAPSACVVSDGKRLPARVRYIVAAVNFAATAYSTVTVATIKMLHCVWVPGSPLGQRRLFIRGSVVCDYVGWQVVYVLGIAVLVAVPMILLFVTSWAARRREAAPLASALEGAVPVVSGLLFHASLHADMRTLGRLCAQSALGCSTFEWVFDLPLWTPTVTACTGGRPA
jgi:hypothetical protein